VAPVPDTASLLNKPSTAAPPLSVGPSAEDTAAPKSSATSPLPRGIRNNNPGNIDRDGTEWQGMAVDQSGDPRFIVFISPEYGIRALGTVLHNYQTAHGLRTIRGMINRWAPPVENDSLAYVDFVAGYVGLAPDTEFDFADYNFALPFTNAVIAQENANYAYPMATVDVGLSLAGIVKMQLEA
jgi:hypothetical protein